MPQRTGQKGGRGERELSLIRPASPQERADREADPDLANTEELVSAADIARAHDRPRAPDGEMGHRAKSPPLSPQERQALREARERP